MSLLWKLRFCLRFTLQTRGILTESLDIPNDPYVMYANPQGEITTALNIACHKSLFNKNYPPHIIICILGSMGPIYGEIKRIGDTQLGVPTQCILLKRLARKNGIDQICSNIFLKVNAKLGGQNVILTNDQIDFVSSELTMILGADIFHSGRGDNRPSIAAVCASLDSKATRYAGRFSVNKDPRNEIIEDFKGIVINLLCVFYQRNQVLLRKILFYRDGVGETQFQHVKTYEVKALKDVFAILYRKKGIIPDLNWAIVIQEQWLTEQFSLNKSLIFSYNLTPAYKEHMRDNSEGRFIWSLISTVFNSLDTGLRWLRHESW
ncbi:unnamed protein product [Rhizophagus irregularis]|nr:unnamed protein product [Rhizophagus irregularis]